MVITENNTVYINEELKDTTSCRLVVLSFFESHFQKWRIIHDMVYFGNKYQDK